MHSDDDFQQKATRSNSLQTGVSTGQRDSTDADAKDCLLPWVTLQLFRGLESVEP